MNFFTSKSSDSSGKLATPPPKPAECVPVKVEWNGDIRLAPLRVDRAWTDLCALIIAKFPSLEKRSFSIKVKDDEGDLITVSCNEDVSECIGVGGGARCVKFQVFVAAQGDTQPADQGGVAGQESRNKAEDAATPAESASPLSDEEDGGYVDVESGAKIDARADRQGAGEDEPDDAVVDDKVNTGHDGHDGHDGAGATAVDSSLRQYMRVRDELLEELEHMEWSDKDSVRECFDDMRDELFDGQVHTAHPAPTPVADARDLDAFYDAVIAGDVDKVDAYLSSGANPSSNNNHALSLAIAGDHVTVAKRLIEHKRFDLSASKVCHVNEAVNHASIEMLVALIDDQRHEFCWRSSEALSSAANMKRYDAVRVLVENGRIGDGWCEQSAIVYCARDGHAESIELMLSKKTTRFDPAIQGNRPIRWAAENGHAEVVKLLMADARVDPAAQTNYSLRWAAKNGHTDVVALLLADERVYSRKTDMRLALTLAWTNGHPNVAGAIIACPHFDMSKDMVDMWIRRAAQSGNQELFNQILTKSDPYRPLNQSLVAAATNGSVGLMTVMLRCDGINPAFNDNEPIRSAIEHGRLDAVKLLLSDGRVSRETKNLIEYIFIATRSEQYEVAYFIMSQMKKKRSD